MASTAPTPKAVAIVLIPALVLMLAFALIYVGALHEPTPHHVRGGRRRLGRRCGAAQSPAR
jgi:hypothetical protein